MRLPPLLTAVLSLLVSCATVPSVPKGSIAALLPEETHLAELRQLTFGGENAEAYWSFDGKSLSLQAHREGEGCDRIYTLPVEPRSAPARLVSSGKGATTCAHFLPGDQELIYASTHLGGEQCPPKPDMSQGYVWALYDTYDIFKANADGSQLRRLTSQKGYDAEGTVCGKDGSIVFTSTRDGDIELYRMDRDGGHLKRLTSTPGYDGGAFFNADCTKLVWRASRPKPGAELDQFRALLAQGLVRPTQLELYVANADGSDAHQVTYLDSASFAPFWVPGEDRIVFSSNYPQPRGREFDLWAINADGTDLERITYAGGFDGFPMFSPDGQWLAFSSNRATAPGKHDTNVFLAKWLKGPQRSAGQTGADRIKRDVTWLSSPEREGRGVGTKGLEAAGAYLEQRFAALGLLPEGAEGGFRQPFEVKTSVEMGEGTSLKLAGEEVGKDQLTALSFSTSSSVSGPLVLAGYGLSDPALGLDDYRGLDVKGKVVVVRRFTPELPALDTPEKQRRLGDLRRKAFIAREKGAVGLLVVDSPARPSGAPAQWEAPAESKLPALTPGGTGGDAGLPIFAVKREALARLWPALERAGRKTKPPTAQLKVELRFATSRAFNVVGRLKAPGASSQPPLIIGAHYDHLGFGGHNSLTPDRHEPHPGADDNASGTAALLEIARLLSLQQQSVERDVIFAAFSGEEEGVLGSAHLVSSRGDLVQPGGAMVNLDMVGRLRENTLTVLGSQSAAEWDGLVESACAKARLGCTASGDGYGPSDQMSFYMAGLPVLHLFTGAHGDYHKPSDTADKLTYGGAAQVAVAVTELVRELQHQPLTYRKVSLPTPAGDARSFGASLGTVPNYSGPPPGVKGMLIDDVRPGGGADKGGLKRGDVLIQLGAHVIGSVEDLMFVLQGAKPGETVTATVLREGQQRRFEVTFQEGRRR